LTDPAGWGPGGLTIESKGEWQNGGVSESAVQPDTVANDVDNDASADDLIARVAADRRAGRDTSEDVEALLKIAAEDNRAALDRLAK
jgi:hypothetical protein